MKTFNLLSGGFKKLFLLCVLQIPVSNSTFAQPYSLELSVVSATVMSYKEPASVAIDSVGIPWQKEFYQQDYEIPRGLFHWAESKGDETGGFINMLNSSRFDFDGELHSDWSGMNSSNRFGVGYLPLHESEPALLSTFRLNVSNLQGTWSPTGLDLEFTATLTDPADERLFKSVSDLSAMSGDMLRQTPSRHWWLGVKRRF